MCTLSFCWGVGPPTKFSKSGEGLDWISIFTGGLLGKRGVLGQFAGLRGGLAKKREWCF